MAAVVAAWERGEREALNVAVARIDAAVVAGLAAVGLPRGPVRQVSVERVGRGWLGQKHPDCRMILDGDALGVAFRVQHLPDDIFRTWVHESLHARQPYAVPATDLRGARGYEEGMVEGLAQLVVREHAGMEPLAASYAYYVAAYGAVAAVTGLEVEALWRTLWTYPTGSVRREFVDVVDRMRHAGVGRAMTQRQRDRLRGLADRAFASELSGASRPDDAALERTLRIVFG